MKTARITMESISPYSQSRQHMTPKLEREAADDYEKRTWQNKMHIGKDGNVFIPPMALKNALSEAAQYMGTQIPGKGKSTYTKHFDAGVLICNPIEIGIKAADVPGEWLMVDSNGKRNSGTRVLRCYPRIDEWKGSAELHVLDEILTKDVLMHHLEAAGSFIGMGRFRPRNRGYYGRFKVTSFEWV